jgi:hypothetical protein
MLVGVQFFREGNDDRVTTTIIQDDPRKEGGDYARLRQEEVLNLLNRLGLNKEQSEDYLDSILHQPPKVRRWQFEIKNKEQEVQVRQLIPGW